MRLDVDKVDVSGSANERDGGLLSSDYQRSSVFPIELLRESMDRLSSWLHLIEAIDDGEVALGEF